MVWGEGMAASCRSQEAVTLICAVPPTSASTLSSMPARAAISIPNSTARESGRCSSRACRTEVTTPRTVSANPGRRKTSTAGAIRSFSPTSAGPAASSPVAAGSVACTRTHIRSPLVNITWTISDVVPPPQRGDPALSKVLRFRSSVKIGFQQPAACAARIRREAREATLSFFFRVADVTVAAASATPRLALLAGFLHWSIEPGMPLPPPAGCPPSCDRRCRCRWL